MTSDHRGTRFLSKNNPSVVVFVSRVHKRNDFFFFVFSIFIRQILNNTSRKRTDVLALIVKNAFVVYRVGTSFIFERFSYYLQIIKEPFNYGPDYSRRFWINSRRPPLFRSLLWRQSDPFSARVYSRQIQRTAFIPVKLTAHRKYYNIMCHVGKHKNRNCWPIFNFWIKYFLANAKQFIQREYNNKVFLETQQNTNRGNKEKIIKSLYRGNIKETILSSCSKKNRILFHFCSFRQKEILFQQCFLKRKNITKELFLSKHCTYCNTYR